MYKHKINQNNNSYLYYSIILFIGIVIIINGCSNTNIKKQAINQSPLLLGVADDVSGSAAQNGVPALSSTHIDRVISCLQKRGGIIAFGLIDEQSFEPLSRLPLTPVIGTLEERAQRNTMNQKAIEQFRSAIEPKLSPSQQAKVTDVNGTIRRFAIFFNEPNNADKVFIFISDGIETASKRHKISASMPDDVKVFAVGMEKDAAAGLFGDKVTVFESIDSAIDAIPNIRGEAKNANIN
ncbi:MAG: hypothetical protein AAB116_07375 [Candidatus Poribacteria bacterium]